jgi:gliding motility-associated-like protein
LKHILLTILVCLAYASSYATHNRAGEIVYSHVTGYTYAIKIITYTIDSSTADRASLEINYGDGETEEIDRTLLIVIANGIQYNEYATTHTYPGPSIYVISMVDPNLIDNIINIDGGASVNTTFYLEDTLKIIDVDFYGVNNSPILLQAPIDYANINEVFVHNPNAFDTDGDSLVYQLITPLSQPGIAVPNYQTLEQIGLGPANTLSLNAQTGELIWDAPQVQGIYSIEYLIKEYRFGACVGTQIRHMQIIVESHDNTPPVIELVNDTCVWAGDTLDIEFVASDADTPNQIITMLATGGPLLIDSSNASYTNVSDTIASLRFTWYTSCDNIRKPTYQMVIKANDNYITTTGEPKPLTDLATWNIKVLAPPVRNLQAIIQPNQSIKLSWDSLYTCAGNAHFLYFSVWRKIGCNGASSKCDNDPSAVGYTLLQSNLSAYQFTDITALQGHEYAYIVVAHFGITNVFGVVHNRDMSAISNEACVSLPAYLPLITNASVISTSGTVGQMYVAWSKPQIPDFDTLAFLPPYSYSLSYKTLNAAGFTPLITFVKNNFYQCNDTTFTQPNINTQDSAFVYQVEFLSAGISVGKSSAPSIYLNATPGDNKIKLNWNNNTPWLNNRFVIYKKNNFGTYDSIATSVVNSYTDSDLTNGLTYCYKIKSIGKYTVDGYVDPIINYSQVQCAVPIDNEPPCAVFAGVANNCDQRIINANTYSNTLSWIYEGANCVSDIVGYQLYFVPKYMTDSILIETINNPATLSFRHIIDTAIAGCYYVQSIDSVGNKSPKSNLTCVESCIEYELPNTFTPNNDGQNDRFVPRIIRYVDYVNFTVYNQWGTELYTTNSPTLDWDGTLKNKDLPTATYYYVCDVYSIGNKTEPYKRLKGSIELLR